MAAPTSNPRMAYFQVIEAVISSLKDELELAGADTVFLADLKRTWETKLLESGALGTLEDAARIRQAGANPQFLDPNTLASLTTPVLPPSFPVGGTISANGIISSHVATTMSLSGTPQFLPPAYPGGPSYQKSGGLAPAALPFAPTSLPQSTAYPAIPAPPPTVPDVKKEEKVHRNLDDEELNSGDELSDGDGEQEIDNYCVCMFDKMSRTKTKRKATLIHGVAHINGRDYIFSKANSEFDW